MVAGAVLAVVALGAPAHATSLVTNGSFETGNFTGWTQFGDTSATNVALSCFDSGCPTDGSYLAYFGPVGGNGGISQLLSTGAGTYQVSFDLSNDQGSFFSAYLGASNLITFGSVASFGVTPYSFLVGTSGPETLSFTFSDPPAYYTLDNVNVSLVSATATTPLPSTWLMLLSGFVGLGFFAYRGTKKNSAALAAA
jgi:hypothetical protein